MTKHGDNDQVAWDPQLLRAERAARGWSIGEAARQLRASSSTSLPGHDSLVKAWKRWERGTEPGRFYGPLLVNLLDTPDPTSRCGIVEAFPRRALVPLPVWTDLVAGARTEVALLQHDGLFLHEQQPELLDRLADVAAGGGRVRLLFPRPDCFTTDIRAAEELVGSRTTSPEDDQPGESALAAEIRKALDLYRPLARRPRVEVRLHTTALYGSLYRFDDEMLVVQPVYGLPEAQSPLLRLRPGDLLDTYTRSFERIWTSAEPATQPT
jgi:hypothetical protein